MSKQSYFVWKGIDCRSKGIYLSGPVSTVRPEERVNHITIPGRSGDLTELEGDQIYNSYIQTATILVKGGYRNREVFQWLRGSGNVTFSGDPEKKQKARIIGAITLNKYSHNLDWWEGEVQFYCEPLKQKLIDDPIVTITTNPTSLGNGGDVVEKPFWEVTAGGTGFDGTVVVSCGGKTLSISEMQSGWICFIDSETEEVLNTAQTGTITERSSGEFPVLQVGNGNTLSGSGWTQIRMWPRERFL